jgi:PAS domain-containing protein
MDEVFHQVLSHRILRPDGEIRWIRDRAFPIRNAQQKIYRIAGIAEDITSRKFARIFSRETNTFCENVCGQCFASL